jgi:hypothetical protein
MYRNLQLYKDVYQLTKLIHRALPKMSRFERFSIGSMLFEKSLHLVDGIITANAVRGKERVDELEKFIGTFGTVEALIRITSDEKILDQRTLAPMYLLVNNISKQANAWKRSTGI